MINDLLQNRPQLLRQIIIGVRQHPAALFRLHQLIDLEDLLCAAAKTAPELQSLLAMLKDFYQGLMHIHFTGIDTATLKSLLSQKILHAWLNDNWQGLSAEQIVAELYYELQRRYSLDLAQFEAEFKRNEQHFSTHCRLALIGGLSQLTNAKPANRVVGADQKRLGAATLGIQQPKQTKPQTPKNMPIPIQNAGLVLLQSFFSAYFKRLNLIKDQQFIGEQAQHQAIHHLQYLATGQTATEEQHLALNKLLCGLPLSEPIELDVALTDADKQIGDSLIDAAIGHWPAIGASSIDGFRGNWLVRPGLLKIGDERWELLVEKRPYDLLLLKAPFSYQIINLPWMSQALYITWPT